MTAKHETTLQDMRGIDYIALGLMLILIALLPQGLVELLALLARAGAIAGSAVERACRSLQSAFRGPEAAARAIGENT